MARFRHPANASEPPARGSASGQAPRAVSKTRLAEALHSRALRLTSRGEYAEAEALFRRAISLAESCCRSSPLGVAAILNDAGVLSKYAGQFERAARLYKRAAALVPPGPLSTEFRATLYHNLAGLEHASGRYGQAMRYARRGLRLRRTLRPIDRMAIAADEAALVAVLVDLGQLPEAEQIQRRVLRAYRRNFGEKHYETASALANLGALLARPGRLPAAERTLRKALSALEEVLGRNHPRLASVLNNLATVCVRGDKFVEADALYDRVLRLLKQQAGPTYPSVALVRANRSKMRRGWSASERRT